MPEPVRQEFGRYSPLSVVLGVINAFDVPARQALVYEMVDDKANLGNALALNSSMVNLARLIGPAVSGLVLQQFEGASIYCFVSTQPALWPAVITSLLFMRLPAHKERQDRKEGPY